MCRRSERRIIAWSAIAVTWIASLVGAADDEVAVWLERNGLPELLAVHLESRLEGADHATREDLVIRLAGLYAQILENIDDPARRRVLEERARRVLSVAPADSTHALRLALLRGAYRAAERTAEQHRLRLSDENEVQDAMQALDELIPRLERLRKQTDQRLELIERRRSRASGADAVVLSEEAEAARALNAQCTFVTAWAQYYQSWLNERPGNAQVAQRLFGGLLDLPLNGADPSDVSVDLRATEPIARCILGYALCRSLTQTSAAGLRWLVLLEHERTFEAMREQAPVWQIVILLEHGEYLEVRTLLRERLDAGAPIPVHWLRLVAVHAIERTSDSRFAADLARDAVTQLASRGELEQVFDLARRYGVEALGTSGFALEYVNGVLRYKAARDAHGDDGPTDDSAVEALYEQAAAALEAARSERDADEYAGAVSDCGRLIAWCRYFQGRLRAAREAFEAAAGVLADDAEASEARWMAIVCLDRLVAADPDNTNLGDQLATTIRRFLEEYPASPHAPTLILRRATTSDEITPELAEELLNIPPNSEVYAVAQRRAAQILYQLFRGADGAKRLAHANRYLLVAVPMFSRLREQVDPADPVTGQRFLVLGRRILEVSLTDGVGRLVAAREVFSAFESVERLAPEIMAPIATEIAYRRLRERLISGNMTAARQVADELWSDDPDDVWTRLASRALFKSAERSLRATREESGDDRHDVAVVFRYGDRVLREYDASSLTDPRVLTYYAAVAGAAFTIWQRSDDHDMASRARDLFERLLAQRPRNARFLRANAMVSEKLGDLERAIECWRTLVAGTSPSSTEWFEARFRLISLLSTTDPERARAVMTQHRALNPDYGPDPWGARLKALDQRMTRKAPTSGEGVE